MPCCRGHCRRSLLTGGADANADTDIPANPALGGARFWFQQAVLAATIAFGGNAPSVLLQ